MDPRPYAVGSISQAFKKFQQLGPLLPALGYGEEQIRELEDTINKTPCDTVLVGTPIDLTRVLKINKPATRASYRIQESGSPTLEEILKKHWLAIWLLEQLAQ